MRLELLKEPAALPGIRAAWEALCDELGDSVTAYASYDWHETWWRHYSDAATLQILALWDAGSLVGIAPLMLRRVSVHGLPATALCFIGNSQSLNNDFIVRPADRELFLGELVRYFFGHPEHWQLMVLKNLPSTSANYAALVKVLDASGKTWRQKQTSIDSPYLHPSGSWEDYLASRTTRTRKGLRNIQNNLRKAGEVSVRNIRTRDEFLDVEEEVFAVARQSWTEGGGDSLASPGNREFFHDLALVCAARGWLSLWTLSLDGRMIAVEFHLRAFGKEHAMRGHYLPEFAALSPGAYLELQILKHAFEEPERVGVYDFCGSFERYKRKWTDSYVAHCDLEIFGDSARARLVAAHENALVPLLQRALPPGFWNGRLFKICGINTRRMDIK
jgi:CelD/BcsL family acetyltransferase involved in cellulose biosynthesis